MSSCYSQVDDRLNRDKLMQHVITLVEQQGLLVVLLNALLAQSGLPLPIIPILLAAAALAQSHLQIIGIIIAGIGGIAIADLFQYWCGRKFGRRFLGLLCRVSFSPDFCVRRTQEIAANQLAASNISPTALLSRCILATSLTVTSGLAT